MTGHLDEMRADIPIKDVIADPAGDAALKQKLHDVQAIREFASGKRGRPDNGSYRAYADHANP